MEQNINGISYQYQILRYRHDVVSGEFANIGLVYFDPTSNYLKADFVNKYGRLSQFFGEVSGISLLRILRQLKSSLTKISKQLKKELPLQSFKSVEELTASILPQDDNALFFSKTYNGWHFEHNQAFEELFDRIVERYQDSPKDRHDDSYAWKEVYKKYFDEYGITPKLKPRKIKTSFTTVDFDKTVQNGALHCFQSLSFDLKQESTIEEKIFRWDGRIRELATSNEALKVYLLSIMPQNRKLTQMIKQKLNYKGSGIEVTVVDERHAQSIAKEVTKVLDTKH